MIEVRSRLKPAAAPATSDQSSSITVTVPHPMPPSASPSECGHGGGLPPYSHTWALNDADSATSARPTTVLQSPAHWTLRAGGAARCLESPPQVARECELLALPRQHLQPARARTRPACSKARRTKCCLPLQRRCTHSSRRRRSSGRHWARPRSSSCSESCSRHPTGPNAPRPPWSSWTAAARATGSSSGPSKGV